MTMRLFAIACFLLLAGTIRADETALDTKLIQRLSVFPNEVHLRDARARQQLAVTGHAADGRVFDMTRLVSYQPESTNTVAVASGGLIRPLAAGKTVVHVSVPASGSRPVLEARVEVKVEDLSLAPPVSFTNEVMAVLGKAGCNAGICHGHASGKGGFKLSLRGYSAGLDHTAMTRDQMGRRINRVVPDASLLLAKPTALVEHGGGQRFMPGSGSHALLRHWLEEGAQADVSKATRLEKIEVWPDYRIMPTAELAQQLVVRAHFAGGVVRDVTEQAIFELTAEGTVTASARGLVTSKSTGEAAVLVRFLGKMAISRFVVIEHRPDFAWSNPPAQNFIDEHLFAKLKAIQVLPSELSSDAQFLRRVSLDTMGLPPTPKEVRDFLADTSPDKRARKIDELLERPEFADQWALYWLDLLRANESATNMGLKGVYALQRWLRQAIDRNMPYDQFARAFLTARGSQFENPPAAVYRVARQVQMKAESIAELFLGVRIECAQCHDHPFDRWTQTDYNELMRFFHQVRGKDGPNYYDEYQVFLEPETDKVRLQFLDGTSVENPRARDRRAALADWMFGPAKQAPARALVNRVWGKLFGRGIVEPVDDLRFSNPPVNEPLWNALTEDFIAHRYDFKHLVRTILNSRAYQLSSTPNATNASDNMNFARARLRRMPAETLLDVIGQVTGVEEVFERRVPPGLRAVQFATASTGSYFLNVFGRPLRRSNCTCERSNEPTLPQTLHLMNGATVLTRLRAEGGTLDRLLEAKLDDGQLVEELYLHILSRPPTPRERKLGTDYLAASDDRAQGAEDLLWALLNSRQFLFNH